MDREEKSKIVGLWKDEISPQHVEYYLGLRFPDLQDFEIKKWSASGKHEIRAVLASRVARKHNFELPHEEKSGLQIMSAIKILCDRNNRMNGTMKKYKDDQ